MELKFVLGFCLLLGSYAKMSIQDNPEVPKYKSFKCFLDSICYTGKLSHVKKTAIDGNTFNRRNGQQVVRNMGMFKQYYFSERDNACYSFLEIGKKRFTKDTLMCWQQFKYWPDNSMITYNKASFIVLKSGPYPDNCVGGACRINFYPVIGMDRSDTSLHYFVNTDDVAGIRYTDINKDGFLDFCVSKVVSQIVICKGWQHRIKNTDNLIVRKHNVTKSGLLRSGKGSGKY